MPRDGLPGRGMSDDVLLETTRASAEGARILSVLRTGATRTNVHAARLDHWMAVTEGSDEIRLLSYPLHPETKRRLDVSYVPVALAKHVVALGHQDDPMRYRFLDHLRSAEVVEDTAGVGARLVETASQQLGTRRQLGDYVHAICQNVEDMWGALARKDARAAWAVAREVAISSLALAMEERFEMPTAPDTLDADADRMGPAFAERLALLVRVPEEAPALVERLLDAVAARPNTAYREDPAPGPVERRLLAEVKVIAADLARRHGDDVRAVGATGSIGRNSATEGADYDVHVLVRPRAPDDRHRIEFRLLVPTYPGLPRRAELGYTPTTFLDDLLKAGVTTHFSYYHLDHVRHTFLVHDPWGEGERARDEVWKIRPPAGFVEAAMGRIREALGDADGLQGLGRGNGLEGLGDECGRLLLMRYGLGFVKPKYRMHNLDKVRATDPAFFEAYDRLKGLDGLDLARARAGVVTATSLFEDALADAKVAFRYRCEEMKTA